MRDMHYESSKPMYEKIYDQIREDILHGKYRIGDRVPSEKELAEQFEVSRITSKKALELLAAEHLIVRRPGRGSFVAGADQAAGAADAPGEEHAERERAGGQPLIGLVITDFGDSYGTELIYGMEAASYEYGAHLVLKRSFGKPEREEEAIRGLLDLGVDGLIVFPAQAEHFNAEILKLVINRFPLVLIDRHLKGVGAASVSTDNVSAAKKGVLHLLDHGHQKLCFLSPFPLDTTAIEERIEGFIQAHAERGIAINRALWFEEITATLPDSFHQDNIERDIERIIRHLRRNSEITAIFASEYNVALLAKEAIERLGMAIPQDISVICFDSPPARMGNTYMFTHLKQNETEMGRRAVRNIMRFMQGEPVDNRVLLDAELRLGQSTGAVRPASEAAGLTGRAPKGEAR